MKKSNKKVISILLIILTIRLTNVSVYAHQGRTDAQGGHRDNKNKSGLGYYHYHCGNHPAHLHPNGVCPYSSSSSASKSETSSSASSSTKTTSTAPTTIEVTDIKINENVSKLKEGESEKLTATITPDNATNKSVTWKSSDENVATVDSTGNVVAKKAGMVDITAESSNGKTSTIKIKIEKLIKEEEKNTTEVITTTKQNNIENSIDDNEDNSNIPGGALTLGLLGGGTYWGYRRLKKRE